MSTMLIFYISLHTSAHRTVSAVATSPSQQQPPNRVLGVSLTTIALLPDLAMSRSVGRKVNSKVTRTGIEPLFKVKSFS